VKWSNDAAYKSTSKKETLQVIRRVLPNCQDITYSFCFTGAETEIHKIKYNSKIIVQTNLHRRGLRPIPIICHLLDPPSFSLPTTFKIAKSAFMTQNFFFLEKYQYGYQKNAEFYADFKFVDAGFQKCP
jgi:hypothetical protein